MSKCKSCGADIIWIKTENGKSMPCDADQVTYIEDRKGSDTIVTPTGKVLKGYMSGDINHITGLGYIPHWATCPSADRHRRKSCGNRD